ncbi:MAG: hypothetical protein K2W78_07405 [Xanthobacteraceae bacterium]|nr:hypothetical protein [Xanthobacteraceae bacterium]
MSKVLFVAAALFAMAGVAAAADLPRPQPVVSTAPIGKGPIGKGPIGKAPIGKYPVGKGPVVAKY